MQPREVARKAVKEIKKTPPKLFLYSIAGAVAIILLVVGFIAFRIHSENSADEGSAEAPAAALRPAEASREAGLEPSSAAGDRLRHRPSRNRSQRAGKRRRFR